MRTQTLFFWLALARIIATFLAKTFQTAIVGYALYRDREVKAVFKTNLTALSLETMERVGRDDKALK